MRSVIVAALALAACADRALEVGAASDAAGVVDLRRPAADLAVGHDLGARRHVGEGCDVDAQCLSDDCVTPEASRGGLSYVCSAPCDADHACSDGVCVTFDLDVYWCLPACQRGAPAACPPSLICCEGADGFSACVSTAAIACRAP